MVETKILWFSLGIQQSQFSNSFSVGRNMPLAQSQSSINLLVSIFPFMFACWYLFAMVFSLYSHNQYSSNPPARSVLWFITNIFTKLSYWICSWGLMGTCFFKQYDLSTNNGKFQYLELKRKSEKPPRSMIISLILKITSINKMIYSF